MTQLKQHKASTTSLPTRFVRVEVYPLACRLVR